MNKNRIDIKENYIYHLDNELLAILLQDHSSKKNIIWATDNYSSRGCGYYNHDQITIPAITGYNLRRETSMAREKFGEFYAESQLCLLSKRRMLNC